MAGKSKRSTARVTRRELNRLKLFWRTAIRETIKQLPTPPDPIDVVDLFDAVVEEVNVGRKIVVTVDLLATRAGVA